MAEQGEGEKSLKLPRVNFRPLLYSALGLAFGVFLYCRIRFGRLAPSDFLFLACFLPLALYPFGKRKIIALMCVFTVFAAAGTVGIHLYSEAYLSGKESGSYTVEGTVTSIAAQNGFTFAEMNDLKFDGDKVSGKMMATVVSEDVRPGDKLRFSCNVSHLLLPADERDNYNFVNNIRYKAEPETVEFLERDFHSLLFLNAKLYDTMKFKMGGEEGLISYALLTGNSRMVDGGFMTAVRSGGIAHIFAVSGLHIGILYAAILLFCRPLKRWSAIPAVVVCSLYCALCGGTVSALRALIMCIALSLNGLLGRKSDMLGSLSLAGTVVLLFLPAQWLSSGFRLSFGACLGLAMFSGPLSRGMQRIHIPRFLREYLAASLSVQLFTFPILIEDFGYFAVWGLLLNLVIVPLLPFAFLTLLLTALASLIIPPAAAFFLIFPKGLFSVLLFLFAMVDFGYVLTGFAFGSAGVVWLCATIYETERVRLRPMIRGVAAGIAIILFSLCLVAENYLFGGVVIDIWEKDGDMIALVRTEDASVLILKDVGLDDAEDFLNRHTGHIDAAVVLSESTSRMLNVAAFTGAERVYCMWEIADGFHETNVIYGKQFSEKELSFVYETDETLTLFVRGSVVTFGFEDTFALESDLTLQKGCGTLKYFLDYGIILSL